MMKPYTILVVNAGSTSTKLALFRDEERIGDLTLRHSAEELKAFASIWDQYDFRRAAIDGGVAELGVAYDDVDLIAVRGGTVRPIPGGIYEITPEMIADMKSGEFGSHPCSVVSEIAFSFGREYGIPVITVDTPKTDELCAEARFSGLPGIARVSSFHALNQKATARGVCEVLGKPYEEANLVVAHLGGGISVGAHRRGRIVDVNNALDGEGAFSPERAGTLPSGDLIRLCFSGRYTEQELLRRVNGRGGLLAYLGTTDCIDIERRIGEGDEQARAVYEAMAFQVSKEIGAAAAVLCGDVDAIALTGSLAHSEMFTGLVRRRVGFLAPVHLVPGENEIEALAAGGLRYLRGGERPKIYSREVAAV